MTEFKYIPEYIINHSTYEACKTVFRDINSGNALKTILLNKYPKLMKCK